MARAARGSRLLSGRPAEEALFFHGGLDTELLSYADVARRIAEWATMPVKLYFLRPVHAALCVVPGRGPSEFKSVRCRCALHACALLACVSSRWFLFFLTQPVAGPNRRAALEVARLRFSFAKHPGTVVVSLNSKAKGSFY